MIIEGKDLLFICLHKFKRKRKKERKQQQLWFNN